MGEVTNMILRMRELAVQMENGIYTAKDRDNAQLEVNALLAEIDKIATNTRFNDVAVLDGSYDQTIRAGNTNAETIRVAVGSLKTDGIAAIEQHAVEKAFLMSGGTNAGTDANPTDLDVLEGNSVTIDTSVFSSTFKESFKTDSLGTFSLADSVNNDAQNEDNDAFTIDAKTGKITSKYIMDFDSAVNWSGDGDATSAGDNIAAGGVMGVAAGTGKTFQIEVTYAHRDGTTSHTENIELRLVDDTLANGGTQNAALGDGTLTGIEVETSAKATRAIETLNKALEEVSTAQAKLGAIQNRLTHNIDNLSKGSMLTEQSVGRIVDADFATETSELSKQQILAQAATSMLAQANQSKQSVLALLQ
jgi:flagellin